MNDLNLNTVDGAFNLSFDADGNSDINFDAVIGGTTPLTGVTVVDAVSEH